MQKTLANASSDKWPQYMPTVLVSLTENHMNCRQGFKTVKYSARKLMIKKLVILKTIPTKLYLVKSNDYYE